MADSIEVIGLKDVQKLIKEMPEVGKKTIARSINRTSTHTKSQVSIRAREKTTVKAKYVKANIKIPFKATSNSLNSKVVVLGKRIKLIGYQVRQTKKGVNARVFKSGPLTLRPRAFIATMKSGHKGVFWRKFDTKRKGRLVHRLGITELTDLSLPELINDGRVWFLVQDDANKFLQKELDNNYKFYLDKVA